MIHRYVAVSADLADWLVHRVGVKNEQVRQVNNGVDARRFSPRKGSSSRVGPEGFMAEGSFVVGTVGRMQTVKDPLNLVRAFLRLLEADPGRRSWLRLIMVGDGIHRQEAIQLLRQANADKVAWLPGERSDIPDVLRSLDLFVLPSIAEGLSNTILEAMATGLPVVATRVGGNPDVVDDEKTGILVSPSNADALAGAIAEYLLDREKLRSHGRAARQRVEAFFSMEAMLNSYLMIYDEVIKRRNALESQISSPRKSASLHDEVQQKQIVKRRFHKLRSHLFQAIGDES